MSADRLTTVTQALTPPGSTADAPAGPLSGRYEVLEQVGRGGMGVVFKARHIGLDRLVALKMTLPGVSVERFKREAKLLAQVQSPRVVSVHDFEELPDGRHLLVMEWVDGTDLASKLKAGPLAEADGLPVMRAVAEGMAAAADAGITHRDQKPSNILLGSGGGGFPGDVCLGTLFRFWCRTPSRGATEPSGRTTGRPERSGRRRTRATG